MQNLKQLIENNTFVVVDLETSGLSVHDFIIEVGAVKIEKGKICDEFSTFVNSVQLESLPEEIVELTGITCEQLKGAPYVDEVLKNLYAFAKDSILVAHNLPFDFGFLRNWGFWCGVHFDGFEKDALDTVALAKEILGDKVKNYRLATLADYFHIAFTNHRALADAQTAAKILLNLGRLVP